MWTRAIICHASCLSNLYLSPCQACVRLCGWPRRNWFPICRLSSSRWQRILPIKYQIRMNACRTPSNTPASGTQRRSDRAKRSTGRVTHTLTHVHRVVLWRLTISASHLCLRGYWISEIIHSHRMNTASTSLSLRQLEDNSGNSASSANRCSIYLASWINT